MSCGQRNIIQFHGICFNENHGLCIVTRMMEGGSVHDIIMQRSKRLSLRDMTKIALDVADGLAFMNSYGIAYRDLNARRILLDRQGNACLGDMGLVTPCNNAGEVTEYETSGYRWLAPEIIAGDPESVSEMCMSNVYSYGMVLWEMVTGEEAYSTYSPVQAAVGIAACGLRPEIPRDCPHFLRSLMTRELNSEHEATRIEVLHWFSTLLARYRTELYVALSRGVSRQTTRILAKPKKEVDVSGKSTKNIVYKDVLAW